MENLINNYNFYILIIFPGLISSYIYKFLMPTKNDTWQEKLFNSIFYGSMYFILYSPFIIKYKENLNELFKNCFTLYAILWIIFLFMIPIIMPIILIFILKSNFIKNIHLPFPSAWDYFFDKKEENFVIIHLKNREKVAGYFGQNSYATSFPNQGDIYLEKIISLTEEGKFGDYIKSSNGIIIKKEDWEKIEFYYIQEEESNEK